MVSCNLISFPLRWGKGRMGVDVLDLSSHLNPPPPWVEEIFLGSIGVKIG